MEKRANASRAAMLADRLSPFGAGYAEASFKPIVKGLGYGALGGLAGALALGNPEAIGLSSKALPWPIGLKMALGSTLIGGTVGKLVKDHRTRSLLKSVTPEEAREILKIQAKPVAMGSLRMSPMDFEYGGGFYEHMIHRQMQEELRRKAAM
jgi:hypothetical protein